MFGLSSDYAEGYLYAAYKQTDVSVFTQSITGVPIIGFIVYRLRKNNPPLRLTRHSIFFYSIAAASSSRKF
jgi:hypothetical protein